MPCFHPWRTALGKVATCGQCRGCRSAYHREWAMRCNHEASLHEFNSFITLTLDDDHLPVNGSLDRRHFPLFVKRLRKEVGRVRYYHCGEYGESTNRPHYHSLLFGVDFADKTLLSMRKDFPVFRSALLESLWTFGLSEVGSVTPQSASYVTRYIAKRMTGGWARAKYGDRVPEYGTMSRNPGIGAGWIDKFRCEVYAADGVVVRGSTCKPPRYYDVRSERVAPEYMDGVKLARHLNRNVLDSSPERLAVLEKCAIAQEDFYKSGGAL